jgi:hypothetical protein
MSTPDDLLGGITFLASDGQDTIVQATPPKPPASKKPPARRALDDLIAGISANDTQRVTEALPAIAWPLSGVAIGRVMGAIAESGFNPAMLQTMEQQDRLPLWALVETMQKHSNWSAFPWLCRDADAEKRLDKVLGRQRGGGVRDTFRRHWTSPTFLEQIPNLDLPRLFDKAGDLSQIGIPQVSSGLMNCLRQNTNVEDRQRLAKALDCLFAPEMAKAVWKQLTPSSQRRERALMVDNLVWQMVGQKDTKLLEEMEETLKLAPNLRSAWKDYWNPPGEPWAVDAGGMRTPFTYKHFGSVNGDQLDKNMGIQWTPALCLMDLLMSRPDGWIADSLCKTGPVADQVYDYLRTGDRLAKLVNKLTPNSFLDAMPHLIDRLGVDWRDGEGRTLGHVFVMAPTRVGRHMVQRLLRDPRGQGLLEQPDKHGRTAIDAMRSCSNWQPHRSYVQQLTRKLLQEGAVATPPVRREKRTRSAL